jgi:hypothetical protein
MTTSLNDDARAAAAEVLLEVVRAEAAGAPEEALRHAETSPHLADSPSAWLLRTLVDLGQDAPGWLWSRWMTVQAHRGDLSEDTLIDPAVEFERVLTAAYVNDVDISRRPEFAPEDFWVTLLHCDWIVRQLQVYEGGELRRLVEERAGQRLLERADSIADWVDAPMRGLQLHSLPVGPTLWFTDLATGSDSRC